jgi:hypothetical protein
MKPASKAMIETQIPDGYQKLEKLEKRLGELQKMYSQDHNLLIAKCEELEVLKRRVMALENIDKKFDNLKN